MEIKAPPKNLETQLTASEKKKKNPDTQEIKRTLLNWTKQDKTCLSCLFRSKSVLLVSCVFYPPPQLSLSLSLSHFFSPYDDEEKVLMYIRVPKGVEEKHGLLSSVKEVTGDYIAY